MMPNPHTEQRLRETLAQIATLTEQRGFPPTVRELAVALGVKSTCTVDRYLGMLEARGQIARGHRTARTLRFTEKARAA